MPTHVPSKRAASSRPKREPGRESLKAHTPAPSERPPSAPAVVPDPRTVLMAAVCERVANGELVKYAAKAEGTTAKSIREWALSKPELGSLYAQAREGQAHALAEQAIEIAEGEDALTQLYEEAIEEEDERLEEADNKGRYKIIAALKANLLNRDRMRMDARKWLTSKIAPRFYGDRLEVAGDPSNPLVIQQVWQFGKKKVVF